MRLMVHRCSLELPALRHSAPFLLERNLYVGPVRPPLYSPFIRFCMKRFVRAARLSLYYTLDAHPFSRAPSVNRGQCRLLLSFAIVGMYAPPAVIGDIISHLTVLLTMPLTRMSRIRALLSEIYFHEVRRHVVFALTVSFPSVMLGLQSSSHPSPVATCMPPLVPRAASSRAAYCLSYIHSHLPSPIGIDLLLRSLLVGLYSV